MSDAPGLDFLLPVPSLDERELGLNKDWCMVCDRERYMDVKFSRSRIMWLGRPRSPWRRTGFYLNCLTCRMTLWCPVEVDPAERADVSGDVGVDAASAPFLGDRVEEWGRAVQCQQVGKLSPAARVAVVRDVLDLLSGFQINQDRRSLGLMALAFGCVLPAVALWMAVALAGPGDFPLRLAGVGLACLFAGGLLLVHEQRVLWHRLLSTRVAETLRGVGASVDDVDDASAGLRGDWDGRRRVPPLRRIKRVVLR